MTFAIGIDLGGTKIAGLLVNIESRAVLSRKTIPTIAKDGPDVVTERIAGVCHDLVAQAGLSAEQVDAVGVGAPASVDYDRGCPLVMPNLPGDWYGYPLCPSLAEKFGRPASILNDARAFTLAEAVFGAARGYPVVAGFTLGTGIGGGLVINGQLHLGLSGRAGEFGHITVDQFGILDGTGAPGSIEALGSGPAIAAAGVRAVMQGINTRIGGLVNYDLTRITPDVVMRAAELDDPVALDILHRAGTAIGLGISNVLNIVAPHCVIFGGGVAALGEWIFKPIRETLRRYNSLADLDRLVMVQAALGPDAGGIGVALWAVQRRAAGLP